VEAALMIARDLTDYMRASDALREVQTELAHVNRVTTMGQLAASIAHEVSQPIAATVTNADAALRWLGRQPPQLSEVRQAIDQVIKDGHRAGEVIGRMRALISSRRYAAARSVGHQRSDPRRRRAHSERAAAETRSPALQAAARVRRAANQGRAGPVY
jgi:C4-dicarboxylate-specific signal transduction histidine kinase